MPLVQSLAERASQEPSRKLRKVDKYVQNMGLFISLPVLCTAVHFMLQEILPLSIFLCSMFVWLDFAAPGRADHFLGAASVGIIYHQMAPWHQLCMHVPCPCLQTSMKRHDPGSLGGFGRPWYHFILGMFFAGDAQADGCHVYVMQAGEGAIQHLCECQHAQEPDQGHTAARGHCGVRWP